VYLPQLLSRTRRRRNKPAKYENKNGITGEEEISKAIKKKEARKNFAWKENLRLRQKTQFIFVESHSLRTGFGVFGVKSGPRKVCCM
jgi:excinuclease UvrABC helicase subunit UvrB